MVSYYDHHFDFVNFRIFRLKFGYTQAELGSLVHLSREYINRLENGLCEPSLCVFLDFCSVFKCSSSDLLF